MAETIEFDIDDQEEDQHLCYKMSELALADWLRPEEDEAWSYLQPEK